MDGMRSLAVLLAGASSLVQSLSSPSPALRAGMMLCDVPSPALIIDCTTARQRGLALGTLDGLTSDLLYDLLYVHTTVQSGRTREAGAVGAMTRGTARTGTRNVDGPVLLAVLDASEAMCGTGAFVGLGLNNHFTGSYYWGRSSGAGASLPAPGVRLAPTATGPDAGRLQMLRVEGCDNSNDGKRSEWCEFLRRGDELQLVVAQPEQLAEHGEDGYFDELVGICRDGDGGVPRGAEPVVEALWKRTPGGPWERQSLLPCEN